MLASASTFTGVKVAAKATVAKTARRANVVTRAGQYDDELLQTAVRRLFFFLRLLNIVSSPVRVSHRRRLISASRASIDRSIDAWVGGFPARSRVRRARRWMRVIERETNRGIFPRNQSLGRPDGTTPTDRRDDGSFGPGERARDDPTLGSRSGLSFPPHG